MCMQDREENDSAATPCKAMHKAATHCNLPHVWVQNREEIDLKTRRYQQNACSVLQCVAVCCRVLQCAAVCCNVLQCVTLCCNVLQGGN